MFSLEENAKAQECLDKAMPVFKRSAKPQSNSAAKSCKNVVHLRNSKDLLTFAI